MVRSIVHSSLAWPAKKVRYVEETEPPSAPLGMIGRDSPNQTDVAAGYPGSTARPTGSSSPVTAVPFPVPSEDRCWLDQHQPGARDPDNPQEESP